MGLIKRYYVKVEDRNYLPKKSDISTLRHVAGFEDSNGDRHIKIMDTRRGEWVCVNCGKWGKIKNEN